MTLKRILAGAFGVAALMAANQSALAGPPSTTAPATAQVESGSRQSAHASLQLDIGKAKAWVGQALPVTVRAYFRGAEGATLEGRPELTSPGLFTSELAREPHQSTQMIGGEPVLVVTWTGTVTPSSEAPLPIAVQLPVKVRYREAVKRVEPPANPFGDDPFAALGGNPFDTSVFDQFFQQSMGQAVGRVREEAVTLKTSTRTIDVQALPTTDRPASFTGAIGRFDLKASVSSIHANVSEPVTLRVVVDGSGDLDRVDLAGVTTSDTWKAYPPKSSVEAATKKGGPARKVFEQVLVPLRGGDLSVPAVSLVSFDPDSGRYITRETTPLAVSVDGAAIASAVTPDVVSSAAAAPIAPLDLENPQPDSALLVVPRGVSLEKVALSVSPVVLFIAAAGLMARARRKQTDRALRRAMRKAASQGEAVSFYRAAHALIETRLSERCAVQPEDVSADFIRDRLGHDGDALAEALIADEALRFGRGRLESVDLVPLCSSIEQSLGGAS